MIIDSSVFKQFRSSFFRKYIRILHIFFKNFHWCFIGNEKGNLSFTRYVYYVLYLQQSYMYYQSFFLRIQSYSNKFFIVYKLNSLLYKQSLGSSISSLFQIFFVNLILISDRERKHILKTTSMLISATQKFFSKNRSPPFLFCKEKLEKQSFF